MILSLVLAGIVVALPSTLKFCDCCVAAILGLILAVVMKPLVISVELFVLPGAGAVVPVV